MFPYRFMKWICLNSALRNLNQFFTEDILMIFLFCLNHLNISQNIMHIFIHVISICLIHLNKKNAKLSFLDVEVSRKQSKFATAVYRKPNFSSVYGHFEGFFTNGIQSWYDIHANCRCFNIYSDWIKFHEELSFLKNV